MKFVKVPRMPIMGKSCSPLPSLIRSLFPGKEWPSTCWQFLRYCLVGGVNTLIDVSVINALLWRFPTHNVQLLVLYNSVAYASGAVSSFFLNKYWTFQRKQRPTHWEGGRFLISVVLEIVSSNGLLWLAGMALSPFIANGMFVMGQCRKTADSGCERGTLVPRPTLLDICHWLAGSTETARNFSTR